MNGTLSWWNEGAGVGLVLSIKKGIVSSSAATATFCATSNGNPRKTKNRRALLLVIRSQYN
jgi:hypothetical protein